MLYYKLVFAVLFVLNSILLVNNYNLSEEIYRRDKVKKLQTIKRENAKYEEFELESYLHNFRLPDSTLSNYSKGSYVLIYVYAGTECGKCIWQDLEAIKSICEENFIVFPVIKNDKNAIIKAKNQLEGLSYVILNRSDMNLPNLHGVPRRFFAVLNAEQKIVSHFFPRSEWPSYTKKYLDFVLKKYLLTNEPD